MLTMRLSNCTFDNAERESILRNVKNLTFNNVRVNGKLL